MGSHLPPKAVSFRPVLGNVGPRRSGQPERLGTQPVKVGDAEAAVLKNQLGVAGLGKAIFFSDDGAFGVNFLDITGDNAEGAYATSAVPPASAAKEEFEAAYKEA